MFWFFLVVMSLVAIVFAVWPLARNFTGNGLLTGIVVVAVAGLSAAVYSGTGRPGVPSGPGEPMAQDPDLPDVGEIVISLAERLEREPDDLEGWKMLARSYATLGDTDKAIAAWERAVEVSSARDASALIGLGEALMAQSGRTMTPRAVGVFENALALEPNNSAALFWGGIAAFNRGDTSTAADRWELLLGTNPPPDLRPVIEERIAVWRGEPVPVVQAPVAPPAEPPPAANSADRVVAASLSLGDEAAAALPGEAVVFVIARDPGQPSPPIAVTRRRLSELPMVVELGNGDSMVAGRELSNFAEFELVARVSLSGGPAAQPGDWFGSTIVRPADGGEVDLTIGTRVE